MCGQTNYRLQNIQSSKYDVIKNAVLYNENALGRPSALTQPHKRRLREGPQTPSFPVAIGAGSHPFPFRTRKLSLLPPMVLPAQVGGRVGRCRGLITKASSEKSLGLFLWYAARSSLYRPRRVRPISTGSPPRGIPEVFKSKLISARVSSGSSRSCSRRRFMKPCTPSRRGASAIRPPIKAARSHSIRPPHVAREPIGMVVLPLLTSLTQGWADRLGQLSRTIPSGRGAIPAARP